MPQLGMRQHHRSEKRRWTPALLVILTLFLGLSLAQAGAVGFSAETPGFSARLSQAGPDGAVPLPAKTHGLLTGPSAPTGIPTYTYRVVNSYPHDPNAFTEGLIFTNTCLYESTGMWADSDLRRVDLETGEVLQQVDLEDKYFGEGLTLYGDRFIQLTYLEHTGLVYDRDTFTQTDTFTYTTQGWGLTHDGQRLIMGDGTAHLYFLDPQTFSVTGSVSVTADGRPVYNINELEYIDGQVYANIWLTDKIARIDPATGHVTAWIDLTGLEPPGSRDVLNGIAYDALGDRLFVTGKYWPLLFEIELVQRVSLPLIEKNAENLPSPTPSPAPTLPAASPTATPSLGPKPSPTPTTSLGPKPSPTPTQTTKPSPTVEP